MAGEIISESRATSVGISTHLYEDRISGAKAVRPGLALALEVARSSDQLVVWRLDRLSRSISDLSHIP